MKENDEDIKKRKIIEKKFFKYYLDLANCYAPLLTMLVVLISFISLILSNKSLLFSKEQLTANLYTSLSDLEIKIYSDVIYPGNEYLLSAIYCGMPNENDYKKNADLIIDRVAKCSDSLNWNTIPKLYDEILLLGNSSSPSNIEAYHKLMSALSISDRVFSLVYRAFMLYKSNKITEKEWKDYEMYIFDLVQSPLFLCAIHINHSVQYYDDDFAQYVKDEYNKNVEIKALIQSLYPEMFENDWIKQVKTKRNNTN